MTTFPKKVLFICFRNSLLKRNENILSIILDSKHMIESFESNVTNYFI